MEAPSAAYDRLPESDDSRLNQLGYKQELRRTLSAIANFSVTFSIISILTGITTLFNQGLTYGGPVSMVYGWPIVGLMTFAVGLSMAEIISAYPTSGGLYYWAAKLCTDDWAPFASWLTGWIFRKFFRKHFWKLSEALFGSIFGSTFGSFRKHFQKHFSKALSEALFGSTFGSTFGSGPSLLQKVKHKYKLYIFYLNQD